jgi:hypothetical protein
VGHDCGVHSDTTTGQLDLIRTLMAIDPAFILFGGFAEDALLYAGVSRPHDDVDVLVWLDELPARQAQLSELGFGDFEVRFEPAAGRPLAVGALGGPVDLELCIGQRTKDGSLYFELPDVSGPQRVWLPEDALEQPTARLENIEVRVPSPLLLYQVRTAMGAAMGGLRPKDEVTQSALHSRFFPDVPEASLAPRVTRP